MFGLKSFSMRDRPTLILVLASLLAWNSCASVPAREGDRESDFQESLFVLGTLAAAAADVADPDELRDYGLMSIRDEKWDEHFPLRKVIRKEVAAWSKDVKLRLLAQFKSLPSYWSIYSAFFLETLGPAPEFHALDEGNSTKSNPTFRKLFESRASWGALASAVYSEMGLHALWDRCRPLWISSQPDAGRVREIQNKVIAYMRLNSTVLRDLPEYRVIVNPLMAPGNGGNTFPRQGLDVLVAGPAEKSDIEVTIAHEFMHQPVNLLVVDFEKSGTAGIVYKDEVLARAFENSQCAMVTVRENWGYAAWWNYAMEAMIRAAASRIMRKTSPTDSFVYQKEFDEQLAKYERTSQGFEQFLVRALKSVSQACRRN